MEMIRDLLEPGQHYSPQFNLRKWSNQVAWSGPGQKRDKIGSPANVDLTYFKPKNVVIAFLALFYLLLQLLPKSVFLNLFHLLNTFLVREKFGGTPSY